MRRTILFLAIVLGSAFGDPCDVPSQAADTAAADTYPLSVVTSDSGAMYVADLNLPGIWVIADGKQTVYFQASKKFRTPLNRVRCLAWDKQGKLLAGDSSTREIYRFDEPGKPTPLTQGGIGIPMSLGVDSQGDIFVADLEIHRIVKVPAAGGTPVVFAEIQAPKGIFVDAKDQVWVISGVGRGKLFRIAPGGEVEKRIDDCEFQFPHNIVVGADDACLVTDGYAKAIWRIPSGGKPEKWFSGEPLINPVGLTRRGDAVWVADPHAKSIFQFDPQAKVTQVTTISGPPSN